MEFSEDEKQVQERAATYIDDHRDEFIQTFVTSKNPLRLGFSAIFMAGSPGAGKTEFSRRYIPSILDKADRKLMRSLKEKGVDIESVDSLMVRIDADEIRDFLPSDIYHKTNPEKAVFGNAHVVQPAVNHGLNILRKYCFKNEISFIHDGTFSNYDGMKNLIEKSLAHKRDVQIFYIYLDPLSAWEFTQAREYIEGRNIQKENFIRQFFNSRENVARIKSEFGSNVRVNCVLKTEGNEYSDVRLNVPDIDNYLKAGYAKQLIKDYSENDLQRLLV